MASLPVVTAVEAWLASLWTTTPVLGLNVEGQTPADGSAFLQVQYPTGAEAQISVGQPGANTFRETGGIRLILAVPTGIGLATAYQWLDQLRALFRSKQFAGVTTFAPSPGVVDASNDDGNYFLLSTSVEYWFDLTA